MEKNTIKLKKKQHKATQSIYNRMAGNLMTIEALSEKNRDLESRMWDNIRAWHPETNGHQMRLDHKKGIVTIFPKDNS